MKPVSPGMTHIERVVAGTEHLASAVGNRGVHVVSSPATILFIEMACHRAIDDYLEAGEATVGVKFDLAHRGAALPGQAMDVKVELAHRDERNRLRFRAEVVQDGKTIMDGEHQRAVVELARLLRRQTSQPPRWTLWFDFQSPWICLVLARAQELAANCGADIQYCPIQLAIDPTDHSPARAAWIRQDLQDHAEQSGIPINLDSPLPTDSSAPLAACVQAQRAGMAEPFVSAMARARWVDNRDIGDQGTIASIAGQCGLDAETFAGTRLDALADTLRLNTDNALKAGVFDTPTLQFADRLYCGYHRLELLVSHTLASETGLRHGR